jgi:hypothetical protein
MVKHYYEKINSAWFWLDSIYYEKRFLEIIGAIMSVIGLIDAIPFGSIVINESSLQEINPTDAHPNKLSME